MSNSVFGRYAQKFSEFMLLNRVVDISSEIGDIMDKAGEDLHSWIKTRKVALKALPRWLKAGPPKVKVIGFKKKVPIETRVQHWDTYWWLAVLWLQKIPESGIIISRKIPHIKIGKLWDYFFPVLYSHLPYSFSDEREFQIWQGVANASADACRFLSEMRDKTKMHSLNGVSPQKGQQKPISAKTIPKLDSEHSRVRTRDDKWYNISDSQTAVLKVLFDAQGKWVQGKLLKDINERPDKIIKAMRGPVKKLIESHKRNGYRVSALLPQ